MVTLFDKNPNLITCQEGKMNVTPGVINNPVVTQQPNAFPPQETYQPPSDWETSTTYASYQLPLQMSQYYNVFPEMPSTKTWTFPNGCGTSSLVRFTGTSVTPTTTIHTPHLSNYKINGLLPTKRKSLATESEDLPSKMLITEEKMAARMSGMHISSDFVSHSADSFVSGQTDSNIDDTQLKSPPDNSKPQLIVCDELKHLSTDMTSFFPEPLIPVEKPSTALVLWRPPTSYLNVIKVPPEEEYATRSSVIITDITDIPDLDNNISSINDLNRITVSSSVEYPQEVMEEMEL